MYIDLIAQLLLSKDKTIQFVIRLGYIFAFLLFFIINLTPFFYNFSNDSYLINEKVLSYERAYKKGIYLDNKIIIEKSLFVNYEYYIFPFIYDETNTKKLSPADLYNKNKMEKVHFEVDEKIYTKKINIENIIVAISIWVVFTFFLFGINKLDILSENNDINTENIDTMKYILEKDISYSEKIMLELNRRSLILLSSGILMSFIGMAIFFFSLPNTNEYKDINSFIVSIIKPLFILFFIEAIAWFLLKQYRNLLEDFKSFYRIYLKRSNYNIAYNLIKKELNSNKKLHKKLVNSFLTEDLSGKLEKGESTESIESKKLKDENIKLNQLLSLLKK
ncbi:hypothetical protein ACMC56_13255 [Campylobacterota bacterium DY0563]